VRIAYQAESFRVPKTFDAAGIFGGPQVLFVHMKPTHEAQNPMVYGTHRRTPFMNNTMSQRYAVPECTALRRGTSQLNLGRPTPSEFELTLTISQIA